MQTILYLSNTCSKQYYDKIYSETGVYLSIQANKFNRLFAEGLVKNGADVTLLSSRPINSNVTKQKKFVKEKEIIDNLNYIYLPFINTKVLRPLTIYFNAKQEIKRWIKNNDGIIICDVLNTMLLKAALSCVKRYKNTIKVVGIVTDLPEHLTTKKQRIKFQNNLIKKCDAFIFLTKQMNEKFNDKNKPNMVVEGFCDSEVCKPVTQKSRSIMYAGTVHSRYGIKNLLEAFSMIDDKSVVLNIFGDGDYKQQLLDFSKTNNRIIYHGTKSNEEVLKEEQKALLLINPRPNNQEYVKYSFPSKILEYISSGTPTLTTSLPSMPKEYEDYCFVIPNNDPETIALKLNELLKKDAQDLINFGNTAKEWALKNKSNIIVTKGVLEFLDNEVKKITI